MAFNEGSFNGTATV